MQWEVKIQMLPFYCWKTEQAQTFMIKNEYPLSTIGVMPDRLRLLKLMLDKGADVHRIGRGYGTFLEDYNPNKYGDEEERDIYELMKKYA